MVDPWSPEQEPPLTARSVVASTLLGVRPPQLPTALLVRSCGLFGISDGTARVAMSRMVRAGEMEVKDGWYGLTGALRARQDRQQLSLRAETRPWEPGRDGWRTAIVTRESRPASERNALRRAASSARLAELREGVWLRPDNLPFHLPEAEAIITAQCQILDARPERDGAELAAELWELDAWAARARHLERAVEATRPALDDLDRSILPTAFVLHAAVLRHFQADPLLPAALLPSDWPGPTLRRAYGSWVEAFNAVWLTWYRSEAKEASR